MLLLVCIIIYNYIPHSLSLSFFFLSFPAAQLKKELDAFDPAFFEEIEDLKFNYHEAVCRNVELEEQLRTLSVQYGFPLPGFCDEPSSV